MIFSIHFLKNFSFTAVLGISNDEIIDFLGSLSDEVGAGPDITYIYLLFLKLCRYTIVKSFKLII